MYVKMRYKADDQTFDGLLNFMKVFHVGFLSHYILVLRRLFMILHGESRRIWVKYNTRKNRAPESTPYDDVW